MAKKKQKKRKKPPSLLVAFAATRDADDAMNRFGGIARLMQTLESLGYRALDERQRGELLTGLTLAREESRKKILLDVLRKCGVPEEEIEKIRKEAK